MNFQVERLKQLPQRREDTWQGGLIRVPAWVEPPDGDPLRPWAGCWISVRTRLAHFNQPDDPTEKSFDMALDALVEFAHDKKLAGYRPGTIQVNDPALAEYLQGTLMEAGITVQYRTPLATLEEFLYIMAKDLHGHEPVPGLLQTRGITVDLVRAFADAAAEFYRAAPWQFLSGEDLIEIETPFVDAALRYTTVLGGAGDTFGLGFFDQPTQFEALLADGDPSTLFSSWHWMVSFEPLTQMPLEDSDLWLDLGLPVAGNHAYPCPACFQRDKRPRRPGPDLLVFLTGLMRALAQTTEDQIDSARWSVTVTGPKGAREFRLSLPDLLKASESGGAGDTKMSASVPFNPRRLEQTERDMFRILQAHEFEGPEQMQQFVNENLVGRDIPHPEPVTALEKAQDLVNQAYDARGRQAIHLARKAVEICPDCVDAYVLLAELAGRAEGAHDLYSQALAVAERTLGPDFIAENRGHFWGLFKTRPYMRARLGLAETLHDLGRSDEAIGHLQEMLDLNPNDNQGVRDILLECLLETGQDNEAQAVLQRFDWDKGRAVWRYARALVTFRQKGKTRTARNQLKKAIEINPSVPEYLLGNEPLPAIPPQSYPLGSQEEAVLCAEILQEAWDTTPGALEWLESVA